MIERARIAGQYPTRPALYETRALADALTIPPADALTIIERAVPRPVTPVYSQLSEILQISLHRALTRQQEPRAALQEAAAAMRALLAKVKLGPRGAMKDPRQPSGNESWRRGEARLGWALALPALGTIALVALFPIVWTFWESLHLHDLRMPWLGRPFVGTANYAEALADRRFWSAIGHTAVFAAATVTLELAGGLVLALALDRVSRATGWFAPPCCCRGRFRRSWRRWSGASCSRARPASPPRCSRGLGVAPPTWFADAVAAWVPLVLADVWKTTPFVALLLLAGLQNIDRSLYEAADVDGAGPWRQFTEITLPLLRPALLVAFLFRTLDAFRVFDVVYVMTGGGPGTATEPIALYTFSTLLQNLRFGYGSALSVMSSSWRSCSRSPAFACSAAARSQDRSA